ncbi:MAG: hypothetical protein V7K38_25245 [Nostoc sp.]
MIDYCDTLTDYKRLKFLVKIINTLVNEEEAAACGKQLQLPVR